MSSSGSNCVYTPLRFAAAYAQHLSSLISIPAQAHHAAKMSMSVCDSRTLLETTTASSANWSQEHSFELPSGPEMYPSFSSFFSCRMHMRVLKHKLNNNGEQGSPCKRFDVHSLFTAILIRVGIDSVEQISENGRQMMILHDGTDQVVMYLTKRISKIK